jgi:chaperonin GroES
MLEGDPQPLDTDVEDYSTDQDDENGLTEMPVMNFLTFVTEGGNLVEYISDKDLSDIGQDVDERHQIDRDSMSDWFAVMERGLDLARMAKKDKTYPFANASNVHYPLVTSAALQYNARAYPAIVPSGDPVKCAVHGEDPQGLKAKRAERVSNYASYQLKTKMMRWEKDTDTLTFIGPIVGTMFRKYWYDPATQAQKSRLCHPGTVIVNNGITDLSEAQAITEEFDLYMHDIESRRRTGWFLDEEIDGEKDLDRMRPQSFIEQMCRLDLDDDGYEEPYVVTMHKDSRKIMRIAAAYDMDDVRVTKAGEGEEPKILAIEQTSFYVDYHFLPSFDGGFMGHGLGALLGDISETTNTILNQLIDAAHYSSMGGGFIGAKDFRIKGGQARFEPGEWKHVNFHGGDIKNGIVPMSFPQPNGVMFQLLGMMIDAGRELSSTSNIMTGDSANANMPVGTVMALIEQGMQVFTASYKRIFRSLKAEFALLSRMNVRYLDPQTYAAFFDVEGEEQPDPRVDFDLSDMDIEPVADPKSVTDRRWQRLKCCWRWQRKALSIRQRRLRAF